MTSKRIRRFRISGIVVSISLIVAFAGAASAWTGPPDLPRVSDSEYSFGGLYDGTQTVTKQKLTFKIPRITTLSYTGSCLLRNDGIIQQTARVGSSIKGSCPAFPDTLEDLIAAIPPAARPSGIYGFGGKAWVQSPVGTSPAFGQFPPMKINSVAFGSIPVEAVAHISQPVRNGTVVPFEFALGTPQVQVPSGVVVPPYGASPTSSTVRYNIYLKPKFTGPLEVTLSDVKVDGIALNLGATCRADALFTARPREGWYNMNSGPKKGEPGEWQMAWAGLSYLPGTIDIDPFQGCITKGEDLSPMLTGMLSGPGNPVDMTQYGSVLAGWCVQKNSYTKQPVGDVYCDRDSNPLFAPLEATPANLQASAEALSRQFLSTLPRAQRRQLANMVPSLTTLQSD